jgi:hypothetical protein
MFSCDCDYICHKWIDFPTTRCRRHHTFIETSTVFHHDSGGIACFVPADDGIFEKFRKFPLACLYLRQLPDVSSRGNSNRQRGAS